MDDRLRIWRTFIFMSIFFLLAALFFFQVVHADRYVKLALDNRLRYVRLPASRGKIFDCNGVPLALNVMTFDIMGYPLDLKRKGVLADVSELLQRHGIPFTEEMLIRSVKRQFWTPYRAVKVVENITLAQMADLVADPGFLPQLFPIPLWRRTYPAGSLAAHVVGYVGEINEDELKFLGSGKNEKKYIGGDLVGKAGIEQYYEFFLRGIPGEEAIEVDARGRRIRELASRPSRQGDDLVLNLDLGAQRLAAQLLGNKRGAVVALDVNDGAVKVLYSSPSYDVNPLAWGVSRKEWNALIYDRDRPMLDRAIAGTYPPASTFKVLVGYSALAEHAVTRNTKIGCPGHFKLGRRVFHCWRRWGHGQENMIKALRDSCDVYFYQAGLRTGIDALVKWGKRFGVGRPTGIDLPNEASGNIAGRKWKKRKVGESWYQGDTVNYSIGQGYVLMSPIQIARMYAVFANGGKLVTPRLRRDAEVVAEPIGLDMASLKVIQDGLKAVVRRGGTGWRAGEYGVSVAGKTGTAQNSHGDDHALFAGYAPAEKPRYVAVVMVEAGLHGSTVSAPIAGQVLSYLVRNEQQEVGNVGQSSQ